MLAGDTCSDAFTWYICVCCSVMDVVMSSEAEFGSLHEFDREKSRSSEQSSILSFMAATWDFYGGKYVHVCTS